MTNKSDIWCYICGNSSDYALQVGEPLEWELIDGEIGVCAECASHLSGEEIHIPKRPKDENHD